MNDIQDDSDRLKPCPFCGGNASADCVDTETQDHPDEGGYFIACDTCGCSTNLRFACGEDPMPLLVEQWNKRTSAVSPPQAAAVEVQAGEPVDPTIPELPNGAWQNVPCAVCFEDGHPQRGWLFIPHADGKWVSLCKLPQFSEQIIRYWLAEPNATE